MTATGLSWQVRHPVSVVPLFAVLVIAGLLAWPLLPVELLPRFAFPQLVVSTSFGQASPEEVEALVTRPVEDALATISGLRSMDSVSANGVSTVTLRFNWGTAMHGMAAEAREKLDLIADELPREAKPPLVLQYNPAESAAMVLALYGSKNPKELRVLAETVLKPELEVTPGVATVRVTGGLVPEIQVLADPGRLNVHSVDLRGLVDHIKNANINFPGGHVIEGPLEISLRTVGRFSSLNDIRGLPVGSGSTGTVVRVGDVAEVRDAHQDRTGISRMNGQPAVLLSVIKEPESNLVQVSHEIRSRLDRVRRGLPSGVSLDVALDQGPFVEECLRDLRNMAIVGSILTFVVLLVTLRSTETAGLVMVSIPVSVLSTFGFMGLAGVSLNFMSISGLALAVGKLVDKSIVLLESIDRWRSQSTDLRVAVDRGLREVCSSLISSTVTTLVALVPAMFMTGLGQRLFRDFAFTLSCALVISLLTSVILIPALLVWFWGNREQSSERPDAPTPLEGFYRAGLSWAFGKSGLLLGISCVLFLAGTWQMWRLGFEVLPDVEQDLVVLRINLPPESSLNRLEAAVKKAEAAISQIPGVHTYTSQAGHEPKGQTGEPTNHAQTNEAQIAVRLKPGARIAEIRNRVLRDTRAVFSDSPGVQIRLLSKQGFLEKVLGSTESPELLRLVGDDLKTLAALGQQGIEKLCHVSGLNDPHGGGAVWLDQRRVVVDRYRAAAHGISVHDTAEDVRTAVEGKVACTFLQGDKEVDIRVRLKQDTIHDASELRQLPVACAAPKPEDTQGLLDKRAREARGEQEDQQRKPKIIPLGQIARVETCAGPTEILRNNRRRSVAVRSDVIGLPLSEAIDRARAAVESITLPDGYEIRPGAERLELVSSLRSLLGALALAVLLIYVVLVIQFESLVWPLVILTTIPLMLPGPAIVLTLAGIPTNVFVLFGALVLTGIVVNNAILLVMSVNQLRQEGIPLDESLTRGSTVRVRPIVATTLATVMGALPACLGWGGSAALTQPLALTVAAGLLSSMAFTLFVVPILHRNIAVRESFKSPA